MTPRIPIEPPREPEPFIDTVAGFVVYAILFFLVVSATFVVAALAVSR